MIILPHGSIKVIIEKLQVSRPTIRKALRGQCTTSLCNRIREVALEIGGVEMRKEKKAEGSKQNKDKQSS